VLRDISAQISNEVNVKNLCSYKKVLFSQTSIFGKKNIPQKVLQKTLILKWRMKKIHIFNLLGLHCRCFCICTMACDIRSQFILPLSLHQTSSLHFSALKLFICT